MDRRGAAGGRATVEKHGSAHMGEIGKRGFAATVACHWRGDRVSYRDYLGLRRHEAQIDSFVDREPAQRLEQGEKVASMELPVLSGPDDVPW